MQDDSPKETTTLSTTLASRKQVPITNRIELPRDHSNDLNYSYHLTDKHQRANTRPPTVKLERNYKPPVSIIAEQPNESESENFSVTSLATEVRDGTPGTNRTIRPDKETSEDSRQRKSYGLSVHHQDNIVTPSESQQSVPSTLLKFDSQSASSKEQATMDISPNSSRFVDTSITGLLKSTRDRTPGNDLSAILSASPKEIVSTRRRSSQLTELITKVKKNLRHEKLSNIEGSLDHSTDTKAEIKDSSPPVDTLDEEERKRRLLEKVLGFMKPRKSILQVKPGAFRGSLASESKRKSILQSSKTRFPAHLYIYSSREVQTSGEK